MGRQNQQSDVRLSDPQALGHLESFGVAVLLREHQVEEHDVWCSVVDDLKRFFGVVCMPDDVDVEPAQGYREGFALNLVILD